MQLRAPRHMYNMHYTTTHASTTLVYLTKFSKIFAKTWLQKHFIGIQKLTSCNLAIFLFIFGANTEMCS